MIKSKKDEPEFFKKYFDSYPLSENYKFIA